MTSTVAGCRVDGAAGARHCRRRSSGGALAREAARVGTPGCDPTPAKLPFERTGWNTVLLDHFTMQVADYQKEAAYYAALMNWKVRSDDGKQAVLDIGDWGAVIIRGGYEPPPAPTPTATPTPTPAAAGDAGAAAAGRGGGRGGGGGRGTPRLAVFDGFCWGIEPWDAKKVEAELKKRGLNPVADNDPKQISRASGSRIRRLRSAHQQQQPRTDDRSPRARSSPAPFESTGGRRSG